MSTGSEKQHPDGVSIPSTSTGSLAQYIRPQPARKGDLLKEVGGGKDGRPCSRNAHDGNSGTDLPSTMRAITRVSN